MIVFMAGTSFRAEYGGPAVSVPRLARALAELGASIVLWAPDGSAPSLDEVAAHPGIALRAGSLSEALAEGGRFDVIHDNGIWLRHNNALARAARSMDIARIVTVRGMLEPWSFAHKALKKRVAWHLYQKRDLNHADALHCTAEDEAQNVARMGLRPERIVIPNGVDMPPTVQTDPGAQRGKRRMVFLSRVHPKKGIPMLLEAWADLRPKGWELHIAGPAENNHDQEVLAQIDRLGLSQDVRYLGPIYGEDKHALMRGADVFVLPTYTENFGMVVAEALALGTPVLTTTGTPWEMLSKERCGWWVAPTQTGLHDGLEAAMSATDQERRAMGARGRAMVQEHFAWNRVGAGMGAAYEAVLTRRSSAGVKP